MPPPKSIYSTIDVSPPAQISDAPNSLPKDYALYGQSTFVSQTHPGFSSPYQGQNSMRAGAASSETFDLTLFAGLKLWDGGELWSDPEIDQGFGLSNTQGMAGFPSGEAYKVGENAPYLRLSRLFFRQTVNLGGEIQFIESGSNQIGGIHTADNIIMTIGKYSVTDVFDTNAYAHDPRSDFMNWSIVDSGAFDYAADAWGFSKGVSVEWTQSWGTFRSGFFDLSTIPNTTILDQSFRQHEWVGEIEERHQLWEHPGKLKLLYFVNQGDFGNYAEAVQLGQQTSSTPNTALVRHYSSRPGEAINLEQELASDIGLFARASMNDGSREADEFTEINKSLAAGISMKGNRWGHQDDTFGLAAVFNGLSTDARKYFAAGGLGILIGDGQLSNYGTEKIMETYYAYAMPYLEHLVLTLNYQYVVNPAYNEDRGPVSLFGIRIHADF